MRNYCSNDIGLFYLNFLLFSYHRFYLAFENSVCKDYITEKFARANNWVVPIVLKDGICRDSVPRNSYIAVDTFENITALVDYLQYLQENTTAYREYFRWRQTHKITNVYEQKTNRHFGTTDAYCNLCEKIRTSTPKTEIRYDVEKWWNGYDGSLCFPSFASKLP